MKLDFYFIHGWGFDKSFWSPVCKKIEENQLSRITRIIDLGFLSEKKKLNYNLQQIDSKSIFIVHSFGLNWFLKKQIKCGALINFFGVPNFLKLQNNPITTEKKVRQMIENFSTEPSVVLKNFYRKCNVFYNQKKEINIDQCIKSLKELKNEDLTDRFNSLNCKVFSIFSTHDNILNLNKNYINSIKNKNHDISFVEDLEHGFPTNNPELCYKMIKELLTKLNYESL